MERGPADQSDTATSEIQTTSPLDSNSKSLPPAAKVSVPDASTGLRPPQGNAASDAPEIPGSSASLGFVDVAASSDVTVDPSPPAVSSVGVDGGSVVSAPSSFAAVGSLVAVLAAVEAEVGSESTELPPHEASNSNAAAQAAPWPAIFLLNRDRRPTDP
jgi:hypothetical protein